MIVIQNPVIDEIPVGGIALWYGAESVVPDGWHVCDGTDGTLDLTDVFIKGCIYNTQIGLTGGGLTHYHTVGNTGSAGSHSHTYSLTTTTSSSGTGGQSSSSTRSKASHSHSASGNVQSDGSHTHGLSNTAAVASLPTYYRLWYIQRVS